MPELGKATYFLEVNLAEYSTALGQAEEQANAATSNIAKSLGAVDASAAAAGASMGEAGAAGAVGLAGAAGAAAKGEAAVGRSGMLWGKTATSITKAGSAGKYAGLIGLGAAYFALSGGYHWLKESQQGWKLVQNAIAATGDVSGVTAAHASALSDKFTKLTGNSRGTNLQLEAMLLRFTNLRNIGPGLGAIYDRALGHVYNIAQSTGRSITTVGIALGKAMQDPGRYLMMLSRSGVTFTLQQQNMVKQLEATKGVAAAQAYVLHILDTRYGGLSTRTQDTAHKMASSINVQLKVAKDQIDTASASLLKAFVPALLQLTKIIVPVTQYLGQHASMVRKVIIAYVAYKFATILLGKSIVLLRGIAIGAKVAMLLLGNATGQLSAKETIAAAKNVIMGKSLKGEAAAAGEAKTSTLAFNSSLIKTTAQFGLLAIATYAAVKVLDHYIDKARQAQAEAQKALAGEHRTEDTKFGRAAMVFNVQNARHIRDGMTPAAARAAATREAQRIDPLFGKKAGAAQYRKDLHNQDRHHHHSHRHKHYAKPPGTITQPSATDTALGGGWTALNNAYLKAAVTSGEGDDIRTLTAEQAYLKHRLQDKSLTPQERSTVLKQLDSVTRALATARKAQHKSGGMTSAGALPYGLQIALSKAQRIALGGNYKPEIGALENDQRYLQEKLKHTKNMKDRAAIEAELTNIEKQLATAKKAELAAGGNLTKQMEKMVEAAMQMRGTFFGEFASDVFHKDDHGKLIPGSGTGSGRTVNQTNHFHGGHPQHDRHHHTHKIRKATKAAIST